MTAPPRPQWLWAAYGGPDPMFQTLYLDNSPATKQVRHYIEHLERRIEQLEATQREATWRPDMESDLD